jgi:hypothetical protein
MPGRLIGFLACLGAAAGCYSPPEPDCGFVCGPGGACPADYACASDYHCHRNGAPASVSCGPPPADAAIVVDAAPAPQIVSVTPPNDATGVSVDTPIQVFTDQRLQGTPALSVLYNSNGTAVIGYSRFTADGMGIEFICQYQLKPNHRVVVSIAPGIDSLDGVPLASYLWGFDTGADVVPPHLRESFPAAGDTDVPVTTQISVTFDEVVTGVDLTTFTALDGATPIQATLYLADISTYELRPVSSLSPGSTITVSLSGAIQDMFGHPLAPTTFTFTTAP